MSAAPVVRRRGTGDRLTVVLGLAALVAVAVTAVLGLVVSPPDVVQGQLVRLIYVHPGAATAAYVAFGLCALSSAAYLWPRTRSRRWDRLAAASAEVGVMFCAVTIVSGSIWGRAAWGVWWTWDARLTLTALLLALFIGYLALRRAISNPDSRARWAAVVAIACALLVPVDHEATTWWQTLHQPPPQPVDPRLAAGDHARFVRGLRPASLVAARPPLPGRAAGGPVRRGGPGAGAGRAPG
jgi:heme exporter protein C